MVKKSSFCLFSLLFLFLLYSFSYHAISSKIEQKDTPPSGRLVDIGGYRLHINTEGEGSPTVIFEAGCGDFSLTWARVFPEIAKTTRVCSYDRAGLGWSDKGPSPRRSQQFVKELHTLLERAEIKPPYILVGHSLGGVNMSLYAQQYPEEIAGLVLVDAAHEKFMHHFKLSFLYKVFSKVIRIGAPFGLGRVYPHIPEIKKYVSAEEFKTYQSRFISTKNLVTGYDEYIDSMNNWEVHKLFSESNLLQGKPLIVLSRGRPHRLYFTNEQKMAEFDAVWEKLQDDHLKKSTDSKQYTAHKSGHCLHWREPELVIEAIQEIYEKAK